LSLLNVLKTSPKAEYLRRVLMSLFNQIKKDWNELIEDLKTMWNRMKSDDDFIDGCEMPKSYMITHDEDIDGIVLFASIAGGGIADIAKHKAKWEELFGGKRS
jgi:hypothetical protein